MAMVWWVIVGIVAGVLTGVLIRHHTENWGLPIDGMFGAVSGVMGAAVIRGFGLAGVGVDWRLLIIAAAAAAATVYLANDLAWSREEEVAPRLYRPGVDLAVADRQAEIEERVHNIV